MRKIIFIFSIALFSGCQTVSPQNKSQAEDYLDSSKSLVAAGDYRQSLRELFAANELDPNNAQVHYLLGAVYLFGFHKLEDATAETRKAISLSPKGYPEAENLLGVLLMEQGNLDEAIVHLNKAASNLLYDTPYFANQNLGMAFAKKGETHKSIAYFEQALKDNPTLCTAYPPLAEQLQRAQSYDEAQRTLKKCLDICGQSVQDAALRAQCQQSADRLP